VGSPPHHQLNIKHLNSKFMDTRNGLILNAMDNFPSKSTPSATASSTDSVTSITGAVLYLNATPDSSVNMDKRGTPIGGGDGGSAVFATWGLSNGIDIVSGACKQNLGVRVRSGDIFEVKLN
jgi:hypothetical protein